MVILVNPRDNPRVHQLLNLSDIIGLRVDRRSEVDAEGSELCFGDMPIVTKLHHWDAQLLRCLIMLRLQKKNLRVPTLGLLARLSYALQKV